MFCSIRECFLSGLVRLVCFWVGVVLVLSVFECSEWFFECFWSGLVVSVL